jgi:hypothetical protein
MTTPSSTCRRVERRPISAVTFAVVWVHCGSLTALSLRGGCSLLLWELRVFTGCLGGWDTFPLLTTYYSALTSDSVATWALAMFVEALFALVVVLAVALLLEMRRKQKCAGRRAHSATGALLSEELGRIPGPPPTTLLSGHLDLIEAAGSLHQFLEAQHAAHGSLVRFQFGQVHAVSVSHHNFPAIQRLFDRPNSLFESFRPVIGDSIQFANKEEGKWYVLCGWMCGIMSV